MLVAYKKYKVIAVLILVLFSLNTKAGITLPKIIGDNMVLQRNKPIAIWGNASAGEKITVNLRSKQKLQLRMNQAIGKLCWMQWRLPISRLI